MTIPMPEPVILRTVTPDDHRYGHVYGFTRRQVEAYAAAKVREALEEAYQSARTVEEKLLADHLRHVSGPAAANYVANRIRALIPPLPGPVEPTT